MISSDFKKCALFRVKVFFAVISGFLVVLSLWQFSAATENFFIQKNNIIKKIDKIKHSEMILNYTISASSIYLYKNNDNIINAIKRLENDINKLLENSYFKENYEYIYNDLYIYKNFINKKIKKIYEFQSYSSAIKNSMMYISLLLKELPILNTKNMIKEHKKYTLYRENFVQAVSSVFLSKNSADEDFIKNIEIGFFKNIEIKNKNLYQFNQMFLAHINVFYNNYPEYKKLLLEILSLETQDILDEIDKHVYIHSAKKLKNIEYISYLIILFTVLYTTIVVLLLIKSQKENEQLNTLASKLSKIVRIDVLTQLYNRYTFDKDIKRLDDFIFYIVNIDKFKYINDYYGVELGDMVLKKVVNILNTIVDKKYNPRFYRLGADDFGIIIDKKNIKNYFEVSDKIINYFETHEINVGEVSFKVGVTIGINDEKPYLEKANIALKKAKESTRVKYLKYTSSIDNKKLILKNIERTKILYDALTQDRLVPYFQPIIDVKTKNIIKYEVLTRLIHKDNSIESIYPYLQIAKDNKLYSKITKMILKRSAEMFHNKNIEFNINFSIEDIMDDSVIKLLNEIRISYKDFAKKVTFEILESESINDYESIANFIKEVKKYGSKVAIDDFGSGYSNFEHLINLDIDYIKIDGSLIKQIHKDKNSYRIVKLVNNFAQESGIKTVAEFVENDDIYEVLKILEVDYAQGYYFGKPLATLAT